jgi:hypothetical protein
MERKNARTAERSGLADNRPRLELVVGM